MKNIERNFAEAFSHPPQVVASAPGRVNLIGEHLDYNGGPVLPMAIEREVRVAACKSIDGLVHIRSAQFTGQFSGHVPTERQAEPFWVNYCLGALLQLRSRVDVPGLELWVDGTVPAGSGLSSSAALEVATVRAVATLCDIDIDAMEVAVLCQAAENDYVGLNCGLMDQAASSCCTEGAALLLDCARRTGRSVNVPRDMAFVVAHSGVYRGLSKSAYNERRTQCEAALVAINNAAASRYAVLCDVPVQVVEQCLGSNRTDVLTRRARHVATETLRVQQAAAALEAGDKVTLGQLFDTSHGSLRDDYEVSCAELDELTELCRGFTGCYGSRLTGAGFGGATVSLVEPAAVDSFLATLQQRYFDPHGFEPIAFATRPAPGARAWRV